MNQLKRSLNDSTQSIIDKRKKFQISIKNNENIQIKNSIQTITTIENLSNELFYDIFDYLDGYDIINAFRNLNIRYENLLNDKSLLFKIKLTSQRIFETNWKHILITNQHRIYSLNLTDELIIDRLIYHCTIDSKFKNLQSINLNSLPAYKCLVILFDLISLPCLKSLTCCLTSCFVDVSYIYRIIFRLQYLNYFQLSLPFIEDLEDFEQALFVVEQYQITNIEYLIIDHCCTLKDFLSIISFMPKLKHLICQTLFQIDETIQENLIFPFSNLTYFKIDRCELKYNLFKILIENFALHLRVLHLIHHSNDDMYLNAYQWEELIRKSMPNLKIFSLKYYEYFNDYLTLTKSHQTLERYSSSFWFDHEWIIGLELETNYLIYSIQPYKKSSFDQTITYDIKYYCRNLSSEIFNKYLISIYSLIKINYLDIDCTNISLLICLKLIGLLSNLQTFKISSFSLLEAKRLSAEKWKTIQAVAYQNQISKVILDKMFDFGEIQFLTIICPSMKIFHISSMNDIHFELLISFIQMKQNANQLTNLSTICLHMKNERNQIIKDFNKLIEEKYHFQNYSIQQIDNRIDFKWNINISK